jgi:hypothetical protein
MWILFLKDTGNDKVKYKEGDIREITPYGHSGVGANWVMDNTPEGYVKTMPISSYDKFVIVPSSGEAIRMKSLLIPPLVTKSEKEFLDGDSNTEEQNPISVLRNSLTHND